MKQMTFSKMLTVVACVLMFCMSVPTIAVADQAQYIYDDLGRLSQSALNSAMSPLNIVTFRLGSLGISGPLLPTSLL